MATYNELVAIVEDPSWGILLGKIKVAITVKAAEVINTPAPPASLLQWAKDALGHPGQAASDVAYYVIAENKSATVSQILNASDTAVQSNVNLAVDALYGA